MKNKKTSPARHAVQGGIIAALYVVFTLISNAFGLANGAIQIRISEALTILPAFMPAVKMLPVPLSCSRNRNSPYQTDRI